jgi:hypothetical protein
MAAPASMLSMPSRANTINWENLRHDFGHNGAFHKLAVESHSHEPAIASSCRSKALRSQSPRLAAAS